jgi:hypothetical protein
MTDETRDPAASLGSVTKHDGSPEPTAQLPNTVHAGCRSRGSDAGTGDIVRRWISTLDRMPPIGAVDERGLCVHYPVVDGFGIVRWMTKCDEGWEECAGCWYPDCSITHWMEPLPAPQPGSK